MPKSSSFYSSAPFSVNNNFTEVTLLHSSENGYTEVYKGERHGKLHVLKRLTEQESNNPRYQQLMQKEFDISYQLSHSGIVHTLGMENVEGLGMCIIQEFIDGTTWDEFFTGKISSKEKRQILCELCDAIDYMHQHQVIHRDLKPQNILITRNGHHPVIIDFGLADRDCFVILKEPAGTTGYASPEQQQPGVLDNRSDIYSLGVLIDGIASAHDFKLRRIARKCMANNPEKRYVSAREIEKMLVPVNWWRWVAIIIICILGVTAIMMPKDPVAKQDPRVTELQKKNAIQQGHIDSMQTKIIRLTTTLDSINGVNKTFTERVNKEDKQAENINAAKAELVAIAKDTYHTKWMKHKEITDSARRSSQAFLDVYEIDYNVFIMKVMTKHNLNNLPNTNAIKNALRDEWFTILYDMQK